MKKLSSVITVLIGICTILGLEGSPVSSYVAFAQSVRGALSGSVLDPTGAAVPGARITVRNPNTGVMRNTVSSAEGSYSFPELNLGSYDVTVSAAGFSTLVQHGVQVTIGNVSALNLTLKAGSNETTINVDASAPTVETQSSDIGGTVQSREIVELPLALGGVGALRSPESFEFLLPGTTGPGSANSFNGIYTLKISGGQEMTNEDILDGADQTRSENGSEFDEEAPSVEALQEFKVTTGIPTAEYGREGGGIESFVTKSGTNRYHGTAFDIIKNEVLDANTWFNNGNLVANCSGANNTPECRGLYARPADTQNDYGVTLGGPVTIPHVFNGADRLQFFFGWEQLKRTVGGTQISTVPTLAERSGDFTDLYNPDAPPATNSGAINPCDGKPVYPGEIFDPSTQRVVNGTPCRLPFAGNKITQPFSTVATNVLQYIPLPTTSGLINNYFHASSFPVNNTTYTIRIDASPSTRQKIFASYSTRENLRTCCATAAFPYPQDSSGWLQDFTTHFGRAGWDFIISPTILNHFNFGYNRSNSSNFTFAALNNIDYTQQLGIGNAPPSKNFTGIDFSSRDQYRNLGNGLNNDWIDNGFRFNDSVSIERGRSNLKFGVDYRIQQFSPLGYPTPNLIFDRAQTASDPANSVLDGNSFGSLLLGQVSSGNFSGCCATGLSSYQQRWTSFYYAVFAQDDLKVNDKLTLNLGLRWDVDLPRTAAHNFTSNFSATAIDPEYNIPGALVFAPKKGKTRWVDTYFKDIQPRLGFAFTPFADGKTVFRGGAGMISGPLTYADDGGGMNVGYKIFPTFTSSDGFSPAFLADNGYPAYALPPNQDPGIFNGQPVTNSYIRPSYGKPPMLFEWSFQVQEQLAQDLILSIGYLGNKAQNLRSSLENINNIPLSAFALGNQLNSSVAGNTVGVTAPFPGFFSLWGAGAPINRALRPFAQYSAIDSGCCLQNSGMSTYNALLVSLSRRYRNGLSLQISYTWEKNLTNADSVQPGATSIQNPADVHSSKALSVEDLPHTLVLAPLYELPFGKGKSYLNHGVASYFAGGWEIGTIQRYESGQPISFCCATAIPGWDNPIYYRRNSTQSLKSTSYRAGKINPFIPGENTFFNPAAFIDPNSAAVRGTGTYTFGNVPRVTGEVRSQHYDDEDISVMKTTPIGEGVTFIFKAEALNAFNRHIFTVPDTNPTDSSFGIPNATISNPRNIQFTFRVSF